MIYRFDIARSDAGVEQLERYLPDDSTAVEWMGSEFLAVGDRMEAYRGDETTPFARREHSGDVQVLR